MTQILLYVWQQQSKYKNIWPIIFFDYAQQRIVYKGVFSSQVLYMLLANYLPS